MSGLRILADENIPGLNHFFGPLGSIRTLPGRCIDTPDLRGVDVLLVRSVTPVNRGLLEGTPVQFVGTATIGTDHLDTDYLEQAGIRWASAPGCNARPVGDYVLACLALATTQRDQTLEGLTVGIVGCGNVGAGLYRRLRDLGLEVQASDPPSEAKGESGFSSLDAVLACDAVCLHAPLVNQGRWPTHHLLDADRIMALRSDQILISAGRGAVVDNSALRDRLGAQGSAPWVALDVWENEPAIDAALAEYVRIATPHIAGYSLEGKLRGTAMIHEALCGAMALHSNRSMDELLPPNVVLEPGHSGESTPYGLLNRALLTAYDPASDSSALKATLQQVAADRSAAFDGLRKHYPVRREFGCQVPVGVDDPAARRLLHAAGFAMVTGRNGS